MNTEWKLYLIKTDELGDTQWEKRINILFGTGNSIQQTCDGGYIVAGESYLLKTDSLGNVQWKINQDCQCAQQTFDGGYIAIEGKHLIKTDTAGNLKWDRVLTGKINSYANSIQETRDSGYIITGETESCYYFDAYLIKTDSGGNLQWQKRFGGKESDRAYSVQQTFDGGFVIVGETESFGAGKSDVYLIKTDSIGNVTKTGNK